MTSCPDAINVNAIIYIRWKEATATHFNVFLSIVFVILTDFVKHETNWWFLNEIEFRTFFIEIFVL